MKRFCLLFICLLAPNIGVAAPAISSVSGTISHDSEITITGTGFSTKPTASPMLYDDFDDGTTGNTICDVESGVEPQVHAGYLSSYSSWVMDGGGSYSDKSIVYNETSPFRAGSKHGRAYIDTSACWGVNFYVPTNSWFTAAGKELYVSFLLKAGPTTSSLPRQSKALVGYDSAWGDRWYHSTAYDSSCDDDSDEWRQHYTDKSTDLGIGLAGSAVLGEWIRCENYIMQSSANTGDGKWYTWMHRPTIGTPTITSLLTDSAIMRDDSTNVTRITLGGAYWSMCSGAPPVNIDVDEIYIDSTPARVELGNASTWATCTMRTILIPTAWSDTSITATVNQGKFAVGSTAYIYVVDTSGNYNSTGKSVTIGGSGGSVATTATGGTVSGGGTLR